MYNYVSFIITQLGNKYLRKVIFIMQQSLKSAENTPLPPPFISFTLLSSSV